jgi:hypothetical protein
MDTKTRLNETIYCTIGRSKIHGVGVISIRDIPIGTVLFKGSDERYEIDDLKEIDNSVAKIIFDRNSLLSFRSPNGDVDYIRFMNHSTFPNYNPKTGMTMRRIKKGEEITEDYRIWGIDRPFIVPRRAKIIYAITNFIGNKLRRFSFVSTWKPIHLCWWFEKNNLPIPRYFIGFGGGTTPVVTTSSCTDVLSTSATGNGEVTFGSYPITERGFCYIVGTSGDPTTENSKVYDSGNFNPGVFSKSITGLSAGTGYRVRAYAINEIFPYTGYGSTVQLTTSGGEESVVTTRRRRFIRH